MTSTEEIAEFASALRFDDLPDDVRAKATAIILNIVGVQLAASTLPWCALVYRFCSQQGGTPESTIVRYGHRVVATNAALANGTFAHGFEMDDNHPRTSLKGGSVAVPTALAVGESVRCTGRELITAVVAGYEVMARTALLIRPSLAIRGNHTTGSCGALGAAAITGKLRGLDVDRMVYALGVAATNLVGFSEVPRDSRGHLKRTFGGMAAAAGIRAALLAESGLTTPRSTLDPGYGFARSFDVDPARRGVLTAGLGDEWEIRHAQIKTYAQDGYLQPVTQALEQLRDEHSFTADDVAGVVVGTCRHACNDVIGVVREPGTVTDAQFSGPFSVALYLVTGGAGFAEYTDQNLRDPRIRELGRRVAIVVDDLVEREYQERRPRGARVTLRLKSGREHEVFVSDARAMTYAELNEKFRSMAARAIDAEQSERLISAVHELSECTDVSELVSLLIAPHEDGY